MAIPQLLLGKTAIITGGLTGIGRALAIGFSQHGANVCVNYLPFPSSEEALSSLQSQIPSLLAVPGDISEPVTSITLVEEAVEKFGGLDVMVSNAGICTFHEFLDLPAELYSKTVRVNLDGAFYAVQAAAKQMALQGKGGSIIGISSISALVGGAGQTHYTPTKAGILSLMQSTACALGGKGIRCNAILPGTIGTQLNEEDLNDNKKREYMEGRIPLGRLGQPEDIVGPAVFLASDLSGYVTGAQLLVDGGLFVNLQ
ncbi:NAD(P)-binding protein [Atractiella rhizophila]|nr:NAD(P)-binding protein [Atractiella rhizophila]